MNKCVVCKYRGMRSKYELCKEHSVPSVLLSMVWRCYRCDAFRHGRQAVALLRETMQVGTKRSTGVVIWTTACPSCVKPEEVMNDGLIKATVLPFYMADRLRLN